MIELKTRLLGQTMNEYGCDTQIYLKSEADKVIAELEEKQYWERWHKRWLELAEKFKEGV